MQSRAAIAEVFRSSCAAWNAGNLDGFMASYERSPSIVAVSGNEIVHGYDTIRAGYAKTFASARTVPMDVLTFDILEFRLIDADHAFVIGRYRLHSRKAGRRDIIGLSTLLFHKRNSRWAITADHS